MPKIVDLRGQRFGKLVCTERLGPSPSGTIWRFACDCGGVVERQTGYVTRARNPSRSCGCAVFGPREAGRKHGHIAGNKPTKTYYAYQSAKGRCHNPRHAKFGNYGARGIEMCERWRSGFVHFLADMGEAPEGGTLERRDNEKGYEPDNCIWAPVTVQHRNKRTTHNVEAEGKTWMAKDYARHAGVRYTSLLRLLSKGLDATEAAARLRLTATKTLPAPQEV